MAVAYDAVGPSGGAGVNSSTTPLTWTHVNGGNGILVAVTCFSGSTSTVTSVTYGGVSLSLIGYAESDTAGTGGIVMYGLVGATCPTGSNTVSVVFTGANSHNGGSISVSGAASLGTPVLVSPASAATSVSATVNGTTTGGLIVSAVCQGSHGAFSATSPNLLKFTLLESASSASDNIAGGVDPSTGGGASQSVTWTNAASDDWGMVAVEVLPPGAGTAAAVILPQPGSKTWRRKHRRHQQTPMLSQTPASNAPPFIQSGGNTGTSAATVTLGATTGGATSCLIFCTYNTPNTSTFTLGGTAITPVLAEQVSTNHQIWMYQGAVTGTSVVVTGTGGNATFLDVYEFGPFTGIATVDAAVSTSGSGTSQNAGTTSALLSPNEIVVGSVGWTATTAATPAGLPWHNNTQLVSTFSELSAYERTTSTAAQSYTQTTGSSITYNGVTISVYDNPATNVSVPGGQSVINVGAFLNPTPLGYTSLDWTSAANAWSLWTGEGAPNVGRHYMGAPPYAISSDMTEMIAAGCKLLISLTPAFNPTSSTDLASILSFMKALQAAGANCDIALWSEPVFSGLTSAQYIAGVQFYGPTIREFYPLVFNTANGAVVHNSEGTYYPGDAWVDKVGTDYYASGYVAGDRLTTIAGIASGAVPPKPLSIWEFNGSPASTGQTQPNVTTFFNYLISFIQGQQAAGFPVGDLCLFNGAPGASNMGAGTTQNGGFEGGTGNWTSGSGALGTTSAQSHSGSSAATITSSGAGAVNIISCTVANVATQGLACTSGDAINAAGWFKAAATGRAVGVNISYYTSGGVLISTTTGGTVTSNTTGWTQATLTDTAPATSAFCRLIPVFTAVGTGEVHYFDDPELRDVQGANPTNTTTIEFGWDYRIALWQSVFTALNGQPTGSLVSPSASASAFDASVTLVPLTIASAGLASATAAASNPNVNITVTAGVASASGAAANPKTNIVTSAGLASATGAAFGPNVNLGISAGLASATGAGFNTADINIAFTAGLASGTGSALSPPPGVGPQPTLASATGAAFNTSAVNLGITAGLASAAGAALNPSVASTFPAGLASATGAAFNPKINLGISAGAAAAAGVAFNPSTSIVFPAGLASATGAALNPGAGVGPTPSTAVATGAALNASANTGSNATANAGLASATGAAFNPSVSITFPAGLASATGAALAPNVNLVVTPSTASATGAALNPKTNVAFPAGLASATGAAFNPAVTVTPTAGAALATGTGFGTTLATTAAAGLASATGAALNPKTNIAFTAGLASATGAAFNISILVPPRPPENWGGSVTPVTIDATETIPDFGGSITLPNFGGGVVPVTIDGSITLPNFGGTCASLANTYGGTVVVTTYDGSLVGWTMQQIALTLAENNDESVAVAITQNGSPLNLTGATINMYLKTAAGTADGSALLLSSAGGSPAITITNPSGGLCTVAIPRADLTAETNTFYRIDAVFSGLQNTAIYGNITWITL